MLPIDESIFFKLVRVVNLTARPFVESIGRGHRLTLNEWRAMLVLASHPGSAAQDVVAHTGLDKMTVSRALAGLQRRGRLVRRDRPGRQAARAADAERRRRAGLRADRRQRQGARAAAFRCALAPTTRSGSAAPSTR